MGKNIYVGNLSYGVAESDLEKAFSEFGTVSVARIVIDRQTGRSKGFGFVEMESDAEADAAIAALDGKDIDGRSMKVNEARPREDKPAGGRGGRSGGYGGGGGGGGRSGGSGGGGGNRRY